MKFLLATALLLAGAAAECQQISPRGTVAVRGAGTPVPGALVRLTFPRDTTTVAFAFTDSAGRFHLSPADPGLYTLEVRHVGHFPLTAELLLDGGHSDLGILTVVPRTIEVGEVLTEEWVEVVQRGDTTVYVADAFLQDPAERLLELLSRLPGATIRDGVIRIRGEEITRILVDGQPLFGGVADDLLNAIPAGDLSSIEFFHGATEQEQFSGFTAGEGPATLNIVTKRRATNTLATNGGYGEAGRYRGSISWMQSDSSGLASIGGGSERLMGSRGDGGIASNHSLSGRLREDWSGGSIGGGYWFGNSESENRRSSERRYFPVDGAEQFYSEAAAFRSRSIMHRLDLRGRVADSNNTFIVAPNISYSRSAAPQSRTSLTSWTDPSTFSRIFSSHDPVTSSTQVSGTLFWGHRFELPGRTFSINIAASSDRSDVQSALEREADALRDGVPLRDTLHQTSSDEKNLRRFSGRVIYTEPLTATSRVAIDYRLHHASDRSEKLTLAGRDDSGIDTMVDPTASGEMTQQTLSQRVGFGIQQQLGSVRVTAMLSHDLSRLQGERTTPGPGSASATYASLLPRVSVRYLPESGTSWDLHFQSEPKLPSILDLQDVIDNSNPLLLRKGNPGLRQSVDYTVMARHASGAGRQFSDISLRVSYVSDAIGRSTTVLGEDSIFAPGVRFLRGTQISEPYNGNRSWQIAGWGNWNGSLLPKLLDFGIRLDLGYSSQPWRWNGIEYSTSTFSAGPDLILSATVAEELRLRIDYWIHHRRISGGPGHSTSRRALFHGGDFSARWKIFEAVELKNETRLRYDPDLSQAESKEWITWNLECTLNLPGPKRGELILGLYDILDPGRTSERKVQESYVEESSLQRYGRYLMLSFRYSWL